MLFYYALAASGSSFIWRFKVQAEILWVDFLVNARLRAACILLVVYAHHVTSKSHDVHIYARVVHFNKFKLLEFFGSQGRKFGNAEGSWSWLQLVCCAYLQSRPGYFKWRLHIEFPECAGMEEVYQNDSEYKYEGESNRGSEFRGMQNAWNAPE